ncbi:MAG: Ig-like domain-containing protein, partial [Gemmatimonadota bacterium]|nr:Ig-like domain-containing protein [Gemmatimonadota bacterium]
MLESPTACRRVLAVLGIAGLASACADSVEPVAVASVEVTSPLGALLDVGGTAQLSATAMNPAGEAVNGISFTWTSSNPDVVSVSAAGFSEALGVGTATVRAGAGGVGGSLAIRVVDADLPAISALARDPYMAALVGVPSEDVHAR